MTQPGRRSLARRRGPSRGALVVLGATAAVLVACCGVAVRFLPQSSTQTAGAAALPVALTCAGVPDGLSIGVVVSLSAVPGEGAEWKDAANGAVVAAHRFAMGGCDVRLIAVDDHGSIAGARAAVDELATAEVSGIVLATSGPHTSGAVEAAREQGIAAVLPYSGGTSVPGDGVWALSPSRDRVDAALASVSGAGAVLVVDAGGGTPDGVHPVALLTLSAGADTAALVESARPLLDADAPPDRILVTGPAETQGAAVAALQAAGASMPILLTPDAQAADFATALLEAGGTLSGDLTTVGPASGDAVALGGDRAGQAMSAFLAGVRIAAGDEARSNLSADRVFREVAPVADTRSHDAVVALVRAAVSAGSRASSGVVDALRTSAPGPADGLAGPAVDFTRPEALTAGLVPLHATPQDLGLRPSPVPLLWFPERSPS